MKRLFRLMIVLLVLTGATGAPLAIAGFVGGAAGAWLVVLNRVLATPPDYLQRAVQPVTQRQTAPEWVRVVEMEGGGGIVIFRQFDGRLATRYYRVLA